MNLGEDKEPFDYSGIELYDLEQVAVRRVPYDEQAEFFGVAETEAASGTDVEW
jgi:hypothetical protein